ncbi:MAG: hypothetical protein JW765_03850 [Deltaproteobacteria bacterium]|nr:hypothetical protein [Candidatus Zymogenaceae bacterium]
MRRLKALCILPVALMLLSCAPSLVPVSVPGGIADVKAGSLTLTKEGVSVSVYADAWRYDPMDVGSAFTPFLVAVSNNTAQDIAIHEDSIFMYDENNVQYGVVPAEAVDRAIVPAYGYYPPMVFWGGGYSEWTHWGIGWSPSYAHERYASDVVPLAFRFGPITAGARVHGFVYLQRLSSSVGRVRIVITPLTVTGEAVSFTFPFVFEP